MIRRLLRRRRLKKERKELLYLIKEAGDSIAWLSRSRSDYVRVGQAIESRESDMMFWEDRVEEINKELGI